LFPHFAIFEKKLIIFSPHQIFESPIIKGKTKPSTERRPDFNALIKVSKSILNTQAFQDVVLENTVELILQYFNAHALSIAFPELAVPVSVQLKHIAKKLKNVKASKAIQQLLEKLEQNRTYIEKQRASIDFAPNNAHQVTSFLVNEKKNASPLRQYYTSLMAVKQRRYETEAKANEDWRPNPRDNKRSPKGKKGKRDEEESDYDEEPVPKKVSKKRAAEDEEEDEESGKKKKAKVTPKQKAPQKPQQKKKHQADGEEEDDLVEDFDSFSSDDE